MQPKEVFKIAGHVAQKRQFGGPAIAEDLRQFEFSQQLIGDFADRAHEVRPIFCRMSNLYHCSQTSTFVA